MNSLNSHNSTHTANVTRDKTVLIIEDDANTADLVALYLRREGFQALTANNGAQGLALAERYRPDLVILDLMLPKVDGWEVCRQLRQMSDVPVIMLTARDEEIDRVAGLTLGADDYVVKRLHCQTSSLLQIGVNANDSSSRGSRHLIVCWRNISHSPKKSINARIIQSGTSSAGS